MSLRDDFHDVRYAVGRFFKNEPGVSGISARFKHATAELDTRRLGGMLLAGTLGLTALIMAPFGIKAENEAHARAQATTIKAPATPPPKAPAADLDLN